MTYRTTLPGLEPRLPTVPGFVHGVVGTAPAAIQCDACGDVYELPEDAVPHLTTPGARVTYAALMAGMEYRVFPGVGRDTLRRCCPCWEAL